MLIGIVDRQSIEYLCHSKPKLLDGKLILMHKNKPEKDEMVKNEKNRIIQNAFLMMPKRKYPIGKNRAKELYPL